VTVITKWLREVCKGYEKKLDEEDLNSSESDLENEVPQPTTKTKQGR